MARLESGMNVMNQELCDENKIGDDVSWSFKNNPGCRYIYRINDSVGCLHHGFSVEKISRAN